MQTRKLSRSSSLLVALSFLVINFTISQVKATESEAPTIAGKFFAGGLLGCNSLDIQQDGTFHLESQSCEASNQLFGRVSLDNEQLRLIPKDKSSPNILMLPGFVYIPVHWGDRLYLVEERSMLEFCNEVNSGVPIDSQAIGREFEPRRPLIFKDR